MTQGTHYTMTRRRSGRMIFVIGGAASAKSKFALEVASQSLPKGERKAFVATGQPLDAEMAERIRRHRVARGNGWRTHEVSLDLAGWFHKYGREYRVILLDCLTLWLSNLWANGVPEPQIQERVPELLQAIRESGARAVVVSNELGLGLVPMEASARRFRDLAGQINQLVAAEADEVFFVVSGIPVRIK